MLIEEFIEASNRSTDPAEVFTLFRSALADVGLDRVVYSLLSDHPSVGLNIGHGVFGNYPDDWMTYYGEKRYFEADPVVHTARTQLRPFVWKRLPEVRELNRTEQLVMNEAEEAGLLDGMAVPLHGPMGEVAGVGLASASGGVDFHPLVIAKVDGLCRQFHLAYLGLLQAKDIPEEKVQLTPQERQILQWLYHGKSYWETGEIMHISENTVRFHVKNIYGKLCVSNRQMAVLKALRAGLITV